MTMAIADWIPGTLATHATVATDETLVDEDYWPADLKEIDRLMRAVAALEGWSDADLKQRLEHRQRIAPVAVAATLAALRVRCGAAADPAAPNPIEAVQTRQADPSDILEELDKGRRLGQEGNKRRAAERRHLMRAWAAEWKHERRFATLEELTIAVAQRWQREGIKFGKAKDKPYSFRNLHRMIYDELRRAGF